MFRYFLTAGRLAIGLFVVLGTLACRDQTPMNNADTANSDIPSLLVNAASGLNYRVIVAGNASPDSPLPWVIALHGVNGDTESLIQEFADLGLDFPCRIYVLQGRNRFQRGGYDWAGAAPSEPGYGAGIMASAQLVTRFADDLAKDGKNLGKPLVTGFSQGAILTLALASHYPEHIGAAVSVSGWLPDSIIPTEKPVTIVPIKAIHGVLDNRLPYDETVKVIETLRGLGMGISLTTLRNTGHELTSEAKQQWQRDLQILLEENTENLNQASAQNTTP